MARHVHCGNERETSTSGVTVPDPYKEQEKGRMDRILLRRKMERQDRRIRIWAVLVMASILLLVTPGFLHDTQSLTGSSAPWPTAALLLIFAAALDVSSSTRALAWATERH